MSRSSGFEVVLLAPPSLAVQLAGWPSRSGWKSGAFVARYSGGTTRELHPVVYSPADFTPAGTHRKPQYVVVVKRTTSM